MKGLREKSDNLFVVHGTENRTLRDFKAVNVQNWENGSRLCGINILVCVPGCSRWTCFCFAVTDNAGHDEVWIIHYCAKGDAESIPKLASFVDAARCFCIDMTTKWTMLGGFEMGRNTNLGNPPGTLNVVMSLLN